MIENAHRLIVAAAGASGHASIAGARRRNLSRPCLFLLCRSITENLRNYAANSGRAAITAKGKGSPLRSFGIDGRHSRLPAAYFASPKLPQPHAIDAACSRGIELTAAGRAFLDHARLALSQVEAAGEAARRAAYPAKASFVMGFLTGTELEWLPEAVRILRGELPNIEIVTSSQTSPELADALLRRKIDAAFLRPAQQMPDLVFKPLIKEPLIAVLRSDHRLAALDAFSPENLVGETFISVANNAPAVRAAIDDYLRCSGVEITPDHEATSTYMAISLVVSTRGIALLPLYTQNFLPPPVTSRPISGQAPRIELALGYHKENKSPLLKLFLSRVDDLIARVSKRSH